MTLASGVNAFSLSGLTDYTFGIGKALTVTGTGAAPFKTDVKLECFEVHGATTITTGDGADTVEIDNGTFDGAFTLSTAGGVDHVTVEQDNWDGASRFYGVTKVLTGQGDDVVKVGSALADPNYEADFYAAVTLDGGIGNDVLQYLMGSKFFGPGPVAGFEVKA